MGQFYSALFWKVKKVNGRGVKHFLKRKGVFWRNGKEDIKNLVSFCRIIS